MKNVFAALTLSFFLSCVAVAGSIKLTPIMSLLLDDKLPSSETAPGQVVFTTSLYSVDKTGLTVSVDVLRRFGAKGRVSVDYSIDEGFNYNGASIARTGTLFWQEGERGAKSFQVTIPVHTLSGWGEILLNLSNPGNGLMLGNYVETHASIRLDNNSVNPHFFMVDQDHPDADDSNPGTTALPWKTIQQAADTLVSGQGVYVKKSILPYSSYTRRSGQDKAAVVHLTNSGASEKEKIVFEAFPGHRPIIDTGVEQQTFDISDFSGRYTDTQANSRGEREIDLIAMQMMRVNDRTFSVKGDLRVNFQPGIPVKFGLKTSNSPEHFIVNSVFEEGKTRVTIDSPGVPETFDDFSLASGRLVAGFYLLAGVEHVTIKGFEIQNMYGPGIFSNQSNLNSKNIFESNVLHDLYGRDNIGGIRLDNCNDCIVRNNTIYETYGVREKSFYRGNSANVKPYGFHSGIHGYHQGGALVENNEIYHVTKGVFHKNANADGKQDNIVRRNYIHDITEAAYSISPQGSGSPHRVNPHFYDNIVVSAQSLVATSGIDELPVQSFGLKVFNNIGRDVDIGLGFSGFVGVEFYNNILVGGDGLNFYSARSSAPANTRNEIAYVGNNLYFLRDTSSWLLERYATPNFPSADLAIWQQAFTRGDPGLTQDVGVGSQSSIDPLFISITDYSLQPSSPARSAGRYSGNLGVRPCLVGPYPTCL
ncbi:MAG: right-handed parallel beta-helix repeat-containing protein [Arenicella sp.]